MFESPDVAADKESLPILYDLIKGKDKIILSKGHAVPILYAA